jgi:hypothetical protein
MLRKKAKPNIAKNDIKNIKKIVERIDTLATSGDIDKLKHELKIEADKRRFASLPPRVKLRVLRVLAKKGNKS